jgi:CubicO group peptidase (beta-lactamase class C family)
VLAHTSGVSGWEPPFAVEDMYDWEKSTAHLAAQSPWWEPGTASGYHAQNQGHLVGELVRRVTGSPLKEFVARELAAPLDADFQIGAREEDWHRVAEIVPPPPLAIDLGDPDGAAYKTLTSPLLDAGLANTDAWRRADMGALNGHGNARAVARIMRSVTLGGASGGVRLLSPETIELIFEEQVSGIDLVLGVPLRWGIGYGLPHPDTVPYLPDGRICFWGGWGGSMIIMDLDRRMTVSYMMNSMAPGIIGSTRSEAYLRAVYDAVA